LVDDERSEGRTLLQREVEAQERQAAAQERALLSWEQIAETLDKILKLAEADIAESKQRMGELDARTMTVGIGLRPQGEAVVPPVPPPDSGEGE
jgi:hypothetical protein